VSVYLPRGGEGGRGPCESPQSPNRQTLLFLFPAVIPRSAVAYRCPQRRERNRLRVGQGRCGTGGPEEPGCPQRHPNARWSPSAPPAPPRGPPEPTTHAALGPGNPVVALPAALSPAQDPPQVRQRQGCRDRRHRPGAQSPRCRDPPSPPSLRQPHSLAASGAGGSCWDRTARLLGPRHAAASPHGSSSSLPSR